MALSSQVIGRIQCPKCRDSGRDNSGDNLIVYSDGHGYCAAGHGFYKRNILENILRDHPKSNNILRIINSMVQDSSYISSLSPSSRTPLPPPLMVPPSPLGGSLRVDDEEEPTTPAPIGPKSSQEAFLGHFRGSAGVDHPERQEIAVAPLKTLPTRNLTFRGWRGVTAATMEFYGVRSDSEVIVYPWGPKANLVRAKDRKEFWWEGEAKDSQGLFGMDRFVSGHNFAVTITEGALDAMSLYQALGGKYAVVSVKSAPSAARDCAKEFEWLNSFEKIKLAFDNDKPGQEAAQQVAKLFDINKVYWVKS